MCQMRRDNDVTRLRNNLRTSFVAQLLKVKLISGIEICRVGFCCGSISKLHKNIVMRREAMRKTLEIKKS